MEENFIAFGELNKIRWEWNSAHRITAVLCKLFQYWWECARGTMCVHARVYIQNNLKILKEKWRSFILFARPSISTRKF